MSSPPPPEYGPPQHQQYAQNPQYAQSPQYGQSPPMYPPPPPYYQPQQRHGGLATAALVLGIIGLVAGVIPGVCWFVGWPCGALAIVFGAIAWKGWAKAKAGLVLGALGVIAGVLWFVAIVAVVHHASTQLTQYDRCVNNATTQRQINACDRYLH